MVLTAPQKGVPEERLARALNVNIAGIRSRRRLLEGICPEVIKLVRDKHVPICTFRELRRMKPMRQIEAAELMIAMNRYMISCARSLVAATPEDQLIERKRKRVVFLRIKSHGWRPSPQTWNVNSTSSRRTTAVTISI